MTVFANYTLLRVSHLSVDIKQAQNEIFPVVVVHEYLEYEDIRWLN